jgi:hypothetical protein
MPDQDTTSRNDSENHETHTPALILLVLITVVVSAVALAKQPQTQTPTVSPTQTNQPAQQAQATAQYAPVRSVETTADLPGGLLLGDSSLVQNRAVNLKSHKQRLVVYDTGMPAENLSRAYRQWASERGFTIDDSGEENDIIVAEKDNRQLIVVLTSGAGDEYATRAQINYTQPAQ